MTTDQQDVGFEISTQQRAALAGADDGVPRRIQVIVDADDAVDPAVLVERLSLVADTNEILRTTFVRPVGAGRHLQIVHESSQAVVDPTVRLDPRPRSKAPPGRPGRRPSIRYRVPSSGSRP